MVGRNPDMRRAWILRGALGLIVVWAFLARVWGISWGLPDILEEATPTRKAIDLWRGFASGAPSLNPQFFNYPSLTIYLQMLLQGAAFLVERFLGSGLDLKAYVVLNQIDPTQLLLLGRMTSVVFSVGTVVLLYFLVREIAGAGPALWAALILSCVSFHIAESRYVLTDNPLGFFMVLATLLAVRLARRRRPLDYFLFGMSLGLATATKYPGLFAAVCFLPAHLAVIRRERLTMKQGLLDRRILETVLATFLFFFLTSPYVLLDARSFWNDLSFERDHMEVGHFAPGGGQGASLGYYLTKIVFPGFGTVLGVFFLAGVLTFWLPSFEWRIWRREGGFLPWIRKAFDDRPEVVIAGVLPLLYLVLVGSWSMRAARYMVPLAPFAAALAVLFAYRLGTLWQGRGRGWRYLPGTMLLISLVQPAMHGIAVARVEDDTRAAARRWIEQNLPEGTWIAKEVLTPTVWTEPSLRRAEQQVGLLDATWHEMGMKILDSYRTYRVVELPMYVLYPEGSAPYYDLRLYQEVDYMMTSGGVRSRYSTKPESYPNQVSFYRHLDQYRDRVAHFASGGNLGGPEIAIYRRSEEGSAAMERDLGRLPADWVKVTGVRGNRAALHSFAKQLGPSAMEAENYVLGEAIYSAADLAAPEDPETKYALALSLTKQGRYEEALAQIDWLVQNLYRLVSSAPGGGPDGQGAAADARSQAEAISALLNEAVADANLSDELRQRALALLEGLGTETTP